MTNLATCANNPELTSATLPQMLELTAGKFPQSTALIYFGNRIPYSQLLEHVKRFAAGLQALGLQKGDRVALMLPNCPQFIIAYFGVVRAGGVVTATSPMYTPREIAGQWNDAGPAIVLVDRRLAPVVESAVPQLTSVRHIILTGLRQYLPSPCRRMCQNLHPAHASTKSKHALARNASGFEPVYHAWPDFLALSATPHPVDLAQEDTACLQYTGGTTGTSKGAMLTHANLVLNAYYANRWLEVGLDGQLVTVAALPFFHIYAMTCIMIASVMAGGSVVILPRFVLRSALNVVRKYRPTIFHGVPTMYVAFNNAPHVERYGFNSLRVCMSGGAPLPVEVQQRFEALTGGKLLEGYGLTETSPVTHINPACGSRKIGSIGLPIAHTDARIMDLETGTRELPVGEIGEIAIRGPQVMKGYWNKPEETRLALRDGWLYTGDIGRKDADGFYYIVDRKKDMIIAGGYNVYPREVEEVLFECPKVKEAGVIGVPDSYRGETVKAFVVLSDGATATVEEIIAFCRDRLASYKVPRQVVFRDSLPRSAVGKYLRRALREL